MEAPATGCSRWGERAGLRREGVSSAVTEVVVVEALGIVLAWAVAREYPEAGRGREFAAWTERVDSAYEAGKSPVARECLETGRGRAIAAWTERADLAHEAGPGLEFPEV